MKLLSINAGSATVKYGLFDTHSITALATGRASGIGPSEGRIEHSGRNGEPSTRDLALPDHRTALRAILDDIAAGLGPERSDLLGVGHRVVHGGRHYSAPVRVDDTVVNTIRDLGSLAPLHNAVAADGIDLARELLPDVPHWAVFDTAFHTDMPPRARRYAIPHEYDQRGFRRYGFHGISHRDAAERVAEWLERPLDELRLITLHLGSGASATAIDGGRSVDTSMGMTPLEGLVMGTRSGDLDPAAALHMTADPGLSLEQVESILTHESGLRALSGTSDMRAIEQRTLDGDPRADAAVELFCYRIKKYIGAYWAALGGADALIFTGGIGENSALVRERCCRGLEAFGIALDEAANRAHGPAAHSGAVPVLVIPADEERAIAREVTQSAALDGAAPP